jgi:hypothetical protein
MLAKTVPAALHSAAADQIDGPPKDCGEALLHIRPIKQGRMRVSAKGGQQVHVTFRVEFLAERRSEQFKPGDTATPAELAQFDWIAKCFHTVSMA